MKPTPLSASSRSVSCLAFVVMALMLWAITRPAPAQEAGASVASDKPQQGEGYSVTYSPHAADPSCHTNLGPTGAAGWLRGYQFVVVSIQQGSPAYGKLALGDVVLGASGQTFGPDVDPRIALGNAIGAAEAGEQPLRLDVLREGKRQAVAIDLPRLGAYAPTWPARCEKSRAILDAACRSLVDSQMPDGEQLTDGAMGTFLSGLLFLGSGEPRYLDAARRAAYKAASYDYESFDYNNWSMGYGGVLMAEYYLATGDDTVLPKLQEVARMIAKGQMRCGSWGHKSPAGGYGAVNQTGIVAAMAMVLARECGVEVDNAAIDKALDFYGQFAGLGAIPYGDNGPYNSLDNNGVNSSAAVLLHLAGREAQAQALAASVAESYWMREEGHTGAFFSIIWGPLAASLAGEQKLQPFLDQQKWYYDLARQWTGAVTFLPYKEALTRFDDSGYVTAGGDFTTAGMALGYALPGRKLRILGAPPSAFGAGVDLTDDLSKARTLYLARDWKACDAALAAIDPAALNDAQRACLRQMIAAREAGKASVDHVLLEIESNLYDGAPYRAKQQFDALKRCVGESADARFADFEKRFADQEWFIREGQQFYDRWRGALGFSVRSWVPQGRLAQRLLEGVPSARLPIWEPLSPVSQSTPQAWRTADGAPPEGWEQPGFDDSGWAASKGILGSAPAEAKRPVAARRTFTVDDPKGTALRVRLQTVRNAITKVYLNGKLIVDVERGQRGGYAPIMLHERAFELLHKGENVLAVTSTERGAKNNELDVSLEICRGRAEMRFLPVDRASRLETASLTEGETSLQISRTTDLYRKALVESYRRKPVDALLADLGTVIGYHRHLAEDALAEKGLDALKPAIERAGDPEWIVRSAVLELMQKAWKKATTDNDEATLQLLAAQAPAVMQRVADESFWVRVQACELLGAMNAQAKDATDVLKAATGDPHEWVRRAALGALQKVGADAGTLHAAALQALSRPNSSFGVANLAQAIASQPEGDPAQKLAIVVAILKLPPEGGGGASLSGVIDLGCKLDPDGKVMVPVLTEAASDATHLSRQRGNPRGKAITALGTYGAKAASAVPVLKAIVADEAAKGHHEAAQAALKQIEG